MHISSINWENQLASPILFRRWLRYDAKAIYLTLAFLSRFHEVDASSLEVGMAEDVGEARDVFALLVVGAGEDMAHVVWEYFGRGDSGLAAHSLHIIPYLFAWYEVPISCSEDIALMYSGIGCIYVQPET